MLPSLEYHEYAIILAALAGLLYLAITRLYIRRTHDSISHTPSTIEVKSTFKKPDRKPGVWTPIPYTFPLPPAYPDWSVQHTEPLPYRPFRYGPNYFITMGLRKMDPHEWIELDNEFLSFHSQKAERIVQRGEKCCMTSPEAYPAALELLEDLARFLPARYPSLYQVTETGIRNLATGEEFNIEERPLKEDPMQMAARWVQDDLAIMTERSDGKYYLTAGATLLTGFWRLEDKFGMSLDEIHLSGHVPGFQAKLQKGMNNFFTRVMPGGEVLRNNYFFQVDDCLPWSYSIGDENGTGFGWFSAERAKGIEHIWFRSERQSLRRLPRSGGVVFTIRTYFVPVTEIVKEPYVPGRLASAVRSWDDEVAKYKGKDRYEKVLLTFLDEQHRKQVEAGLPIEKGGEVAKYPW